MSFDLKYRKVSFPLNNRSINTTTSSAKIVYWHYNKQNFGVASNVRSNHPISKVYDTDRGLIEEEIVSIKINKELGRPSASFDVTLLPSKNWKKVLAPGDWVAIYLYNKQNDNQEPDDSSNLVLMGNIDRVSRALERNENDDKVELRYNISGRNFGKVFEDTDIWFDPYAVQASVEDVILQQAGIPLQGSPDEMVSAVLDVFLGKGHTTEHGRTGELKQWRMPSGLVSLMGGDGQKLDDILLRRISKGLPGYRGRVMLSVGDNGNLWQQLVRGSNKLINELIIEESHYTDGTTSPTITLRPRPHNTPFFDSQFGGETNLKSQLKNKWNIFQEFAKENFIEISNKEVIYENLGRDDHSRMNLFYLTTDTNYDHTKHLYANKNKASGVSLPFLSRESITRYGLKRFDAQIEFPFSEKVVKEASGDSDLFKAFLVQLYDMNYANHLYDQGTIECNGILEAELGQALIIKSDDPNGLDKAYYIEGYEHEWKFPNMWRTIFTVTKGQYVGNEDNIFIDLDDQEGDFGEEDSNISTSYLTKTRTER